jgi:hypothetical protein
MMLSGFHMNRNLLFRCANESRNVLASVNLLSKEVIMLHKMHNIVSYWQGWIHFQLFLANGNRCST